MLRSFARRLRRATRPRFAAGGKNGTLGRFLARQQRQNRGLQQLTIFDRQGTVLARVGEPGLYAQASFSPDGSRLAVIKRDPDSYAQDVWAFDLATGKGWSITSGAEADSAPVWSPDGRHIAYVSVRANTHGIYRRASSGQGSEELLYQHPTGATIVLTDWSADGRFLGFWSGDTMFLLPLTGERRAIELGCADFFGRGGRLSPDGRFLAFNSNQSGRFQIYVSPIDVASGTRGALSSGASGAAQVSADGGIGGIVWRTDGRELFFLSQPARQTVMAVEVTTGRRDSGRRGTAIVRAPEPDRRARAAQQRQQSRRSALRVRRERPEAGSEVSPVSAGPGPSIT
jgi:eukaryotic-like serine/threonine-protein kinase